jgi:predicted DNA-binding mobile mystery protein A
MDKQRRRLMIHQLDHKLSTLNELGLIARPEKGWIAALRTTLNITLNQLGTRLDTSAQNIKGIEAREASGSITLNALRETAAAMDMKLVYALLPKDGSLDALIERRAKELAKKIVMCTSASMKLEDQENSPARLESAIAEKTRELKWEVPKYLWV